MSFEVDLDRLLKKYSKTLMKMGVGPVPDQKELNHASEIIRKEINRLHKAHAIAIASLTELVGEYVHKDGTVSALQNSPWVKCEPKWKRAAAIVRGQAVQQS